MSEQAREYFGIVKCKNPSKYFSIGKWLFRFQRASDYWSLLSDRDEEYRFFINFSKVRNMEGLEMYLFVLGKNQLQWGRTEQ